VDDDPAAVALLDVLERQLGQLAPPQSAAEEQLRAFSQTQKVLKQIAGLNVELLKEHKQRR
jgi:hypothetical protein